MTEIDLRTRPLRSTTAQTIKRLLRKIRIRDRRVWYGKLLVDPGTKTESPDPGIQGSGRAKRRLLHKAGAGSGIQFARGRSIRNLRIGRNIRVPIRDAGNPLSQPQPDTVTTIAPPQKAPYAIAGGPRFSGFPWKQARGSRAGPGQTSRLSPPTTTCFRRTSPMAATRRR